MNTYIRTTFGSLINIALLGAFALTPALAGAQYYGSNQYAYNPNNAAQVAQIQTQLNALTQQLLVLQQTSTYNYNNSYNYNTGYNYQTNPYSTYSTYPTYTGANQYSYNSNVLGAYTGPSCNFTYDLALGSSGGQVADLNRVLGVGSNSYFDQATYNAVVRFQTQYAAEILVPSGLAYPTGTVGPFTRAKLNAVCNGMGSTYGGSVLGTATYNPYYTSGYNPYATTNYNQNYNQYQYPYNYNYTNTNQNSYVSGPLSMTLTVAPQIVNYNEPVMISWTSTGSTLCRASGGWSGDKQTSGSEQRTNVSYSTTYVMTCYGINGESMTRSVIVNVGSTNSQVPTITFYASPASLYQSGASTLTWNVLNATTCQASGDWSGSRNVSGTEYLSSVTSTKTYVLTCTSSGGRTASASAAVAIYTN